jgi:hypothetical protein
MNSAWPTHDKLFMFPYVARAFPGRRPGRLEGNRQGLWMSRSIQSQSRRSCPYQEASKVPIFWMIRTIARTKTRQKPDCGRQSGKMKVAGDDPLGPSPIQWAAFLPGQAESVPFVRP